MKRCLHKLYVRKKILCLIAPQNKGPDLLRFFVKYNTVKIFFNRQR